jgi:hypothetical protein
MLKVKLFTQICLQYFRTRKYISRHRQQFFLVIFHSHDKNNAVKYALYFTNRHNCKKLKSTWRCIKANTLREKKFFRKRWYFGNDVFSDEGLACTSTYDQHSIFFAFPPFHILFSLPHPSTLPPLTHPFSLRLAISAVVFLLSFFSHLLSSFLSFPSPTLYFF